MFKVAVTLCIAITLVSWCEGKVYGQCEFAWAMYNNGVTDLSKLGTWTCIAYQESRFNTEALNSDTGNYGILQISHIYWCSDTSTPGKECGITCQSLLNDDITDDIICAKHVYLEARIKTGNGFAAWPGSYSSCTGNQTGWISGCGF